MPYQRDMLIPWRVFMIIHGHLVDQLNCTRVFQWQSGTTSRFVLRAKMQIILVFYPDSCVSGWNKVSFTCQYKWNTPLVVRVGRRRNIIGVPIGISTDCGWDLLWFWRVRGESRCGIFIQKFFQIWRLNLKQVTPESLLCNLADANGSSSDEGR